LSHFLIVVKERLMNPRANYHLL